jgi:hypothetical protein
MNKLVTIQRKLKAPKNQYNSFSKFKYRSCEDILEAVKPLLDGAWLTLSDEIIMVGQRYYVKATATFVDGDFVCSTTAYAREEESKKGMDGSQISGTASSYARKYALNGLLLCDDTKDADTDEHHQTTKAKADPPKTDPRQQRTEAPPRTLAPKQAMYETLKARGLTTAEMSAFATHLKNTLGELTDEIMANVADKPDAWLGEWKPGIIAR